MHSPSLFQNYICQGLHIHFHPKTFVILLNFVFFQFFSIQSYLFFFSTRDVNTSSESCNLLTITTISPTHVIIFITFVIYISPSVYCRCSFSNATVIKPNRLDLYWIHKLVNIFLDKRISSSAKKFFTFYEIQNFITLFTAPPAGLYPKSAEYLGHSTSPYSSDAVCNISTHSEF